MCRLSVLLVGMVLILATLSCQLHPQTSACTVDDLLLTADDFPVGSWREAGPRDSSDLVEAYGIEAAWTSFSTQNGHYAGNAYYLFSSEVEARSNFLLLSEDLFYQIAGPAMIVVPDELNNLQTSADNYRLGCVDGMEDICLFVGRYDTYVVDMRIVMPSMVYTEFAEIIGEIDDNMQGCAGK